MSNWEPAVYKDYRWIVADPQLLGGKLAIHGARLSVSPILECLAGGMSLAEIDGTFDQGFPHEALPEVLKVASELTDPFPEPWAVSGVPYVDVERHKRSQGRLWGVIHRERRKSR